MGHVISVPVALFAPSSGAAASGAASRSSLAAGELQGTGAQAEQQHLMDVRGGSNSASGGRQASSQPFLMSTCWCHSCFTALCSLLCGAAFMMSLYDGSSVCNQPLERFMLAETLLRLFGILFSVIVALNESGWEVFSRQFKALDNWVVRGAFQLHVSALTQLIAVAYGNSDFQRSVYLYRTISSSSLAACGLAYLFLGLCGMQRAKYLREQQERERVIAQLELDEVEKRRSELQKKLDISQSNVAPMKLGSSK
mmetsp:Transcript_6806/g.25124  ORF Transcript_6806/g.25124 Transcript_6806/m.25124 type:complete len:254 (+) Transcript_6806:77-838(+)